MWAPPPCGRGGPIKAGPRHSSRSRDRQDTHYPSCPAGKPTQLVGPGVPPADYDNPWFRTRTPCDATRGFPVHARAAYGCAAWGVAMEISISNAGANAPPPPPPEYSCLSSRHTLTRAHAPSAELLRLLLLRPSRPSRRQLFPSPQASAPPLRRIQTRRSWKQASARPSTKARKMPRKMPRRWPRPCPRRSAARRSPPLRRSKPKTSKITKKKSNAILHSLLSSPPPSR